MKVLVTGGGGFLGLALCRALQAQGYTVRSIQRRDSAALRELGVEQVLGDLANAEAVRAAVSGVDAIVHNAAMAGAWGPYQDYYRANVLGTRNVLQAARAAGVRKVVYTSTPSVTHRATHPVAGQSAAQVPYGEGLRAPYAATKKLAEIEALAANDASLAVTALRPRLIWGAGDNHLLPRLVERSRAGRLRLIGSGDNLIDSTYVTNAADAHVRALQALEPGSRNAGKAYFISNGEPRSMKDTVNALLDAAGEPPVSQHIPAAVAMAAAHVMQAAYRGLPLRGEPLLTPFVVEQMLTTHWYDMTPAREDFGYVPAVSFDQGIEQLRRSFRMTA